MKILKIAIVTWLILLNAQAGFADPPASHGMLLFGDKAKYVSHLPMFHSPHDYQLLSEVELGNMSKKTRTDYQRLQMEPGIFTIDPERMDLTKVISGEKTSFTADLYQGHFERGGTLLGPVTVTIKKILKAHKIAGDQGQSNNFLAFGKDDEYFLAHEITGQPSYDAIYAIGQPYQLFQPRCGRGECPPPYQRPISSDLMPISITATAQQGLSHPENTQVGRAFAPQATVTRPFYIEYDELAP